MIKNENNINENQNKQKKGKTELANNVVKDEDRITKDSDKESKVKFRTGDWTGGLFRIAVLANKVVQFTTAFAGIISVFANVGAFLNFLDGVKDVGSPNVHNKIDGVIDFASVVS